jgi:hypothetical protein
VKVNAAPLSPIVKTLAAGKHHASGDAAGFVPGVGYRQAIDKTHICNVWDQKSHKSRSGYLICICIQEKILATKGWGWTF